MEANPWRAEMDILLDGKIYVMRPTFVSLSRIEQKLGTGLIALARKLADGHITLEELAIIITECLCEPVQVREALICGALAETIETVSEMFALIFGGFREAV